MMTSNRSLAFDRFVLASLAVLSALPALPPPGLNGLFAEAWFRLRAWQGDLKAIYRCGSV